MSRPSYDPFKDENIHRRPYPDPTIYKSIVDLPPSDGSPPFVPPPAPEAEDEPQPNDDDDMPHLRGLDPEAPPVCEENDTPTYYPRVNRPPAPGKRINWATAAESLARGSSVESTAWLVGCKPERIWRNLRRSRRFRARIELEAERIKLQADLRFRNLNIPTVLQMRHRAEKLDMKTLQWLAQSLRLGQGPQEGEKLIDWLEAIAAIPGPSRKPETDAPAQDIGVNGTQLD